MYSSNAFPDNGPTVASTRWKNPSFYVDIEVLAPATPFYLTENGAFGGFTNIFTNVLCARCTRIVTTLRTPNIDFRENDWGKLYIAGCKQHYF